MSATLAPSAAPKSALRVWADASRIYAELPTKAGQPAYIMAFPRTGAGLSKVLALVYGNIESSGEIQAPAPRPRALIGTAKQHALAEAVLRRNRIIK